MRDKVILTDVDGVLLDWSYHFFKWIKEEHGLERLTMEYKIGNALAIPIKKGYELVREFNMSEHMLVLSPYKDAIKYVRKLHEEHGYIFHIITSQTSNVKAQNWRLQNLYEVFGNVFEGSTFLPCGADKDKELAKWEGSECYWIEDKEENIVMGNEFGLDGILMAHEYNLGAFSSRRVKNWKEIYQIITGET